MRQHKLWDEELGMQNHPHVVKSITMNIANGQSDDERRKQQLAKSIFVAKKILGYAINKTRQEKLKIKPGSMNAVVSADASFHLHPDGKRKGGFCVGFAGDGELPHASFMWVSCKQPLVAVSLLALIWASITRLIRV